MNRFTQMNKFTNLSKRYTSNDIRSFYPKCVDCIHFEKNSRSCKKFEKPLINNYVDYNLKKYELSEDVRNDNAKCGESGNLFECNYQELQNNEKFCFNVFIFSSMMAGVTNIVSDESRIFFIPFTISILSYFTLYSSHIDLKDKMNDEKKRIENLNNHLSKNENKQN